MLRFQRLSGKPQQLRRLTGLPVEQFTTLATRLAPLLLLLLVFYRIEHVIARMKKYQVLAQVYRHRVRAYGLRVRNIAALVNLRTQSALGLTSVTWGKGGNQPTLSSLRTSSNAFEDRVSWNIPCQRR
ncbi:MAG: hypothetical protein HYY59_07675 [Candidatus Omnitrophica bacterium]|nr:hypothetical protein [Candidatus Omnitrophota bacterium]